MVMIMGGHHTNVTPSTCKVLQNFNLNLCKSLGEVICDLIVTDNWIIVFGCKEVFYLHVFKQQEQLHVKHNFWTNYSSDFNEISIEKFPTFYSIFTTKFIKIELGITKLILPLFYPNISPVHSDTT